MTPLRFAAPGFAAAASRVADFLQARLGFDLWMVTRAEGDDWIVLQTADRGYQVSPGAVFRWSDSFCSRMVRDLGPRVAADASTIPAYAAAPIARLVPIGSYVGVPIARPDGRLFGTLCGIHPTAKPPGLEAELPLVELFADLLGDLLAAEFRAAEADRRAERLAADAVRDETTGAYSRAAWDDLLAAEERRCRAFGHPAFVAAVAVRAADPRTFRDIAQLITHLSRPTDPVAAVGPGELAVLGVEGGRDEAARFERKLWAVLRAFDTPASAAVELLHPGGTLAAAWAAARGQAVGLIAG
jgi:GAF domain-containing protein